MWRTSGTYTTNWRAKKIKRKQCLAKGCYLPVWGHGYCNKHQYFYAAKRPIPKYKKKKTSRTNSFGFNSQMEVFQFLIYNAPRPIICPVSGRNITDLFKEDPSVWVSCCAHILNKGKWPLFKHNPDNIMLIDPEAHRLWDAGTQLQRDRTGWNFDILERKKEELKRKYEEYYRGQTAHDETTEATDQPQRETQSGEGDTDTAEDADADRN